MPGRSGNVGAGPVSTWTVSDVAAWAGTALDAHFAEQVLTNEIDGTLLLSLMVDELQEDLNCDCPDQRATILNFTQRMGAEAASEAAGSTGEQETLLTE